MFQYEIVLISGLLQGSPIPEEIINACPKALPAWKSVEGLITGHFFATPQIFITNDTNKRILRIFFKFLKLFVLFVHSCYS